MKFMKNIFMVPAIISSMIAPVFSMDEGEKPFTTFMNNAKKFGTITTVTYCRNCQTEFPTDWFFEGIAVHSKHICPSIKTRDNFKTSTYELEEENMDPPSLLDDKTKSTFFSDFGAIMNDVFDEKNRQFKEREKLDSNSLSTPLNQ